MYQKDAPEHDRTLRLATRVVSEFCAINTGLAACQAELVDEDEHRYVFFVRCAPSASQSAGDSVCAFIAFYKMTSTAIRLPALYQRVTGAPRR